MSQKIQLESLISVSEEYNDDTPVSESILESCSDFVVSTIDMANMESLSSVYLRAKDVSAAIKLEGVAMEADGVNKSIIRTILDWIQSVVKWIVTKVKELWTKIMGLFGHKTEKEIVKDIEKNVPECTPEVAENLDIASQIADLSKQITELSNEYDTWFASTRVTREGIIAELKKYDEGSPERTAFAIQLQDLQKLSHDRFADQQKKLEPLVARLNALRKQKRSKHEAFEHGIPVNMANVHNVASFITLGRQQVEDMKKTITVYKKYVEQYSREYYNTADIDIQLHYMDLIRSYKSQIEELNKRVASTMSNIANAAVSLSSVSRMAG